ncbi:MAG: hypothetical protein M3O02_01890, partial [Acidobacteriota bacterium]|nr:hypothetical protein [Acidobacteriota bacterium]
MGTNRYDGENRLSKIAVLGNEANPFVKYTYDAGGTRVRKDNADGTWTEYASFNGQMLAEKDQNGSWTNYVYANGEKVAKVGLQETVFQISGTSTGPFSSSYTVAAPLVSGYVIRSGDRLVV